MATPTDEPIRILRIYDWDNRFENNRTRELKKLDWVPIPNKMDGDGYTELVDHENGAAHLGIWLAIIEIASRCDPRGTLLRDGAEGSKLPHTSQSLARMSRLPAILFDEVIPRLVNLGWVALISQETLQLETCTKIPHDDAVLSHNDASSRAREKGIEGKGIEGKGREGKGILKTANGSTNGILDDFPKFREAYELIGYLGIEADWSDARFSWVKLSFEQKLERVKAVHDRNGSDPAFLCKPRKFLETEWQRKKIIPRAKKTLAQELAEL